MYVTCLWVEERLPRRLTSFRRCVALQISCLGPLYVLCTVLNDCINPYQIRELLRLSSQSGDIDPS
jgi:hypothetical protein